MHFICGFHLHKHPSTRVSKSPALAFANPLRIEDNTRLLGLVGHQGGVVTMFQKKWLLLNVRVLQK